MTVAALYDIHGNAPALAAVIGELRADPPDAVVIGGDVIAGPLPLETLELLRGLPWPVHWLRGNADRAVVMSFDGTVPPKLLEHPLYQADQWVATFIDRAERDWLDQLPPVVRLDVDGLGEVLFCHATPRSDEERITVFTPPERLAPILEQGGADLTVAGHTHRQFDLTAGGRRMVNAGSVGRPHRLRHRRGGRALRGRRLSARRLDPRPRRRRCDRAALRGPRRRGARPLLLHRGRMRYVSYASGTGARVGILDGDTVYDAGFEGDMVAFIAAGAPDGERRPVTDAQLLAPLRPRSLRDFLAFEGHLKNAYARLGREIPGEWYEVPAYYKGMPDTVIGPDETIPWPAWSDRLDHELELAAVIGEGGRDIAAADADDAIFGYTIWNDMSARDVQARELPVGMGPGKAKDWDGSNVLGPCIATPDELDLPNARMQVRVNGEVWGEDRPSSMHHSFADMIAYVSRSQTLYPGEVLGSGTAAGGSGLELDRYLQEGDVVELEIDGIGVLRNPIGRKEA